MGTKVIGARLWTPPTIQTAAELGPLIGRDEDWIVEHTGVRQRCVAEPDADPAEMAAAAARLVLKSTDQRPDWLLHASATRRQSIPDTAVFVQRALGLDGVPALSVQATCLSFLGALQMADGLLAAGRARRVLITSAELPCRVRNYQQPESAALLGDGAAAVLLGWSDDPSGPALQQFQWETWSEGAEYAEIRGGGHRRLPGDPGTKPEDNLFDMDGERLLRSGVPRMLKFMKRLWNNWELTADQIDLVIPHQPSAASLRVLQRIGFSPNQVVNVLSKYGNCVAASMPMALAEAMECGRLKRDDRVLFLGTAAGVSLAAALLRW